MVAILIRNTDNGNIMQISLSELLVNKQKTQKPLSDLPEKFPKEWNWLISKPISDKHNKNLSHSQHGINLRENKIRKSFERIRDIAPYFFRYKTKQIDEIFTAQTLRTFLMELLKDPEHEGNSVLRHDFKTLELGRMLTEIGLYLLQDSNEDETVRDNIKKVLREYKEESNRKKNLEAYAEHKNQKEHTLTKKREIQLLNERFEISKKKKISSKDKKQLQLISKELETKYDHLKPFYCEINPLKEFEYDVMRKYHLEPTMKERMLRYPDVEGVPEELRGEGIPMPIVREIEMQIKSLRNNEIKKLNDKITKLYVFQTTGKIPTIEEWLE